MKVWVLLREEDDYNQHGAYFVKVFRNKPTVEELSKLELRLDLGTLHHLIDCGYTYSVHGTSFDLREEDI